MMRIIIIRLIVLLSVCLPQFAAGQNVADKQLKFNLSSDGSQYIKTTFAAQLWARYTENNPGSTVFGYQKNETFDIGIRRARIQLFGKVHEKVFLYSQMGINSFNSISARKAPVFFHDVLAEYYFTPKSLQMGMGLTAWTGFARFSSPAVASIMGYDAPLYQQSTNDANDQFLRKLSVYAKGKLGKLDYRLVMSDPFLVQTSNAVSPISANSDLSFKPPKLQYSGYFMYQFLEQESNLTPYLSGTYLGTKKVLNLGAGFQYQKEAMWRWRSIAQQDTIYEDMLHFAADVFYDHPLGKKRAAITAYAAFVQFGFGNGYLRNLGVMNTANGVEAGADNLNGAGNAFPMMGTGQVLQAQLGYLLPKNFPGEKYGQLQPYVMVMRGDYERLKTPMLLFDAGINWYIDGYRAKLSLNYQSRPVYRTSDQQMSGRKGMTVLQFQVGI